MYPYSQTYSRVLIQCHYFCVSQPTPCLSAQRTRYIYARCAYPHSKHCVTVCTNVTVVMFTCTVYTAPLRTDDTVIFRTHCTLYMYFIRPASIVPIRTISQRLHTTVNPVPVRSDELCLHAQTTWYLHTQTTMCFCAQCQ